MLEIHVPTYTLGGYVSFHVLFKYFQLQEQPCMLLTPIKAMNMIVKHNLTIDWRVLKSKFNI